MDILGGSEMRYAASCVRAVTPCQMETGIVIEMIKRKRRKD